MSQRWQEPTALDMRQLVNEGGPILLQMTAWQVEAAAERERSIALVLDARRRACELRALLDQSNTRIGNSLAPFQAELDSWLGALLVAREDAR